MVVTAVEVGMAVASTAVRADHGLVFGEEAVVAALRGGVSSWQI